MKLTTKMIPLTLALTAASASAQVTQIRVAAPVAPAAVSAAAASALRMAPALAAPQVLSAPALQAPALSAVAVPAAAPAAAATPAASPAEAKTPVTTQGALKAGAARLDAAAKATASDVASAVSGAIFDGQNAPTPATSATDPLTSLNFAIAEVLKPFNNALTHSSLRFSKIGTNATRPTDVAASLDFTKKSPNGELSVKIGDFTYSYPDKAGAKPETSIKGSIGMNLLNLMPQAQINKMGAEVKKIVEDFVADNTKQYGPAAKVDAKVTHQETDAKGNLTGVGFALNFDADLAKLPATTDIKTVDVSKLNAAVNITLKGLDFAVSAVGNTLSSEFADDQLEMSKLIARDPAELSLIGSRFMMLALMSEFATRGPAASEPAAAPAAKPAATPVSAEILTAVKAKLQEGLGKQASVGIGNGGLVVRFRTQAALDAARKADKFPENIEGVPVSYDVTGPIHPLTATEPVSMDAFVKDMIGVQGHIVAETGGIVVQFRTQAALDAARQSGKTPDSVDGLPVRYEVIGRG